MFFNKKKELLKVLIEKFSSLIADEDKNNCTELLKNREYLLCYNTLVAQIYEYDKEITKEEYEFFKNTAEKLGFETSEYNLLKELVRDKNSITKTVQTKIGKLIDNIKRDKNQGNILN